MAFSTHHLKISLRDVRPAVLREVVVPSDLRLDRLHQVIQIVMGWEDTHMHEFIVGQRRADERRFGLADPDLDLGMGPPPLDEKNFMLRELVPAKSDKFRYWYDFGDDWMHDITVRNVSESASEIRIPACLVAVGACPPEDCGGPWDYARLREALADPKHEDHAVLSDWWGNDWEPQLSDPAAANLELARVSARWNRAPRKTGSAPR